MLKNRKALGIHCNHCPVAALCIPYSLSFQEKEKINAIMTKLYELDTDEHLYYQNEKLKYIFAVYSGSCKKYVIDKNGNEKINGFFFPGDLIALESLAHKRHPSSVAALEKSQFCAIPYHELFKLMDETPALMRRFIHLISKRIKNYLQFPLTTNAKSRIAAFLLDMLYRLGSRVKPVNHFHLPMSQFDIGNLLGLAHETVSRVLHSFQQQKAIRIGNKQIYIMNINYLKNLVIYYEKRETVEI